MNYGLDYYESMLRHYSATAEHICKVRWAFVDDARAAGARSVLDFGSGVGWFRAWRPDWVTSMDSYDVGGYPQTGILRGPYDLITMWDVLEHLPDFSLVGEFLGSLSFAAVTVPMKPEGTPWKDWPHLKPGEHLHLFTREMLFALFSRYGLGPIKEATPECPPRRDILSALFRRRP